MSLLSEVFRAVIIVQAAFVVGISVITLLAYRKRPLIAHISAVATSYLLLTLIVAYSLVTETYARISGRGIMAFIAFGLGDFALLKILSQRKNSRK